MFLLSSSSVMDQFMNLSIDWEKHVFHWEMQNFEPIGDSEPTTEYLALGKPLATFPIWNSFQEIFFQFLPS